MATNVNNRNRQPKGTSKGGQFAPEKHTETPTDLDNTTSSSEKKATIVERYPNGNPRLEEWRNSSGYLDRADGPARIDYRTDGTISHESWYKNGQQHREGGPADTYYYENGNIKEETWLENNETHRLDGPAETK